MKTLVHVRTSSRFANCMQTEPPQLGLEIVYRFEMRAMLAQPFRQSRLCRFELY